MTNKVHFKKILNNLACYNFIIYFIGGAFKIRFETKKKCAYLKNVKNVSFSRVHFIRYNNN